MVEIRLNNVLNVEQTLEKKIKNEKKNVKNQYENQFCVFVTPCIHILI